MIAKDKKRITIAVSKNKVEEIKIKALKSGLSLGDFLTKVATEIYDKQSKTN